MNIVYIEQTSVRLCFFTYPQSAWIREVYKCYMSILSLLIYHHTQEFTSVKMEKKIFFLSCCFVMQPFRKWIPARMNNCAPFFDFIFDSRARLKAHLIAMWFRCDWVTQLRASRTMPMWHRKFYPRMPRLRREMHCFFHRQFNLLIAFFFLLSIIKTLVRQ